MLTDEQKRQIEIAAAQQIREAWGGLNATRVRGVMDDVRAKLVEEAWFGQTTSQGLNDFTYTSHVPDTATLAELYGRVSETAQSAWDKVFGGEAAENIEPPPRERDRDGPEIGG